jgi:hypothetical protein
MRQNQDGTYDRHGTFFGRRLYVSWIAGFHAASFFGLKKLYGCFHVDELASRSVFLLRFPTAPNS